VRVKGSLNWATASWNTAGQKSSRGTNLIIQDYWFSNGKLCEFTVWSYMTGANLWVWFNAWYFRIRVKCLHECVSRVLNNDCECYACWDRIVWILLIFHLNLYLTLLCYVLFVFDLKFCDDHVITREWMI